MTRLDRLKALADDLEGRIPAADDRAAATLAGQLRAALLEIDEIEKAQPVKGATPLDEIAAKRTAKGPVRSAGRRL